MGKNDGYVEYVETANWNVAKVYALKKIFKPLEDLDTYQTIAKFGTFEMEDGFEVTDKMKNEARVKAMERFLFTLKILIDNSKFAVYKKKDVQILDDLYEDVKKVEKVIYSISRKTVNQKDRTTEISINEEQFDIIYKIMERIKTDILKPLNNADLIFRSTEEFDPDKLKAQIEEDIINAG